MFVHKIVTPLFVKRFECVGSECLSHCCQEWFISIDKQTYKKYHNAESIEIREIAEKHVLRDKNLGFYSYIQLKEDKTCPFLDEKKLCSIYCKMGPTAMSNTCRKYPRSKAEYGNVTFNRLSLSCPEVARLLLFSPDAMQMAEEDTFLVKKPKAAALSDPKYLVYLWCQHLIQAPSAEFEDNLYAVVQFLLFLKKVNFDVETNFDRIQGVFEFLLAAAENGDLTDERRALPHPVGFQTGILGVYGKYVTGLDRNGSLLVTAYMNTLTYLELDAEQTQERTGQHLAELRDGWRALMQDSCLSGPHVLRNLFSYLLYYHQFPHSSNFSGEPAPEQDALSQFSLIVMDYFYLRTNFAALSLTDGCEVTEKEVQLLTGAYFSLKMHQLDINSNLLALMKKVQMEDALACICLLDN